MRLKVVLHPTWGWEQISRYVSISEKRKRKPLHVSFAEDRTSTNWSHDQLAQLAQTWAHELAGKVTNFMGGHCAFGRLGTALFQTDQYEHRQVWLLSDGVNFIHAFNYCGKKNRRGCKEQAL